MDLRVPLPDRVAGPVETPLSYTTDVGGPCLRLERTGPLSIPHATWTNLIFDLVQSSVNWPFTPPSSVLTLPATGFYLVGGGFVSAQTAAATVRVIVALWSSAASPQPFIAAQETQVAASGIAVPAVTTGYYAVGGTTIQLQAYQDSGAALALQVDGWRATFWATRVA